MLRKKLMSCFLAAAVTLAAVPGAAVFAEGSETTHKITFETEGLYEVPEEQTVKDGETGVRPASPVLYDHASNYDETGLMFHNWYTVPASEITTYNELCYGYEDGGLIFGSNTPITKDTTVYAVSECVFYLGNYDLSKGAAGGGIIEYKSIYNRSYETVPAGSTGYGTTVIKDTELDLYAEPVDGYSFAGWSTSTSKDDIFDDEPLISVKCEKRTTIYALFEEIHPVTVTVHWSSVDGTDLMDPVIITSDSGTGLGDMVNDYMKTAGSENFFEKDGYIYSGLLMKKPVTEYSDADEYAAGDLDYYCTFSSDTDIYCIMLVPIDSLEITISRPLVGSSAEEEPSFSFPGDDRLTSEGCWWTDSEEDPFEGEFEAGENYYALCFIVPDPGYCLDVSEDNIVINNGTLYRYHNGLEFSVVFIEVLPVEPEPPVTLTLHWSSIDGVDLMEPVEITAESGTRLRDAVNAYLEETGAKQVFEKEGYAYSGWMTGKPITEFEEVADVYASMFALPLILTEDIELYYDMLIPVAAFEITAPTAYAGSSADSDPTPLLPPGTKCTIGPSKWIDAENNDYEGEFIAGNNYDVLSIIYPTIGYYFDFAVEDIIINNGSANTIVANSLTIVMSINVVAVEKTYTYISTKGDGAVWTQGGKDGLEFVFKCVEDDTLTYAHFTGAEMDHKAFSTYGAKEGSLIITLQASYLETLSAGEHILTVNFDNGNSVDVKFTVKAAESLPSTGEAVSVLPAAAVISITLSAALFVVYRRKVRGQEKK